MHHPVSLQYKYRNAYVFVVLQLNMMKNHVLQLVVQSIIVISLFIYGVVVVVPIEVVVVVVVMMITIISTAALIMIKIMMATGNYNDNDAVMGEP
jgi:hypothetical protein